ncbi:amidohydrolase [Zafaria cholistanensis]|uniref:Amidohydrolase n=1 Tax=Zafaria cholistanensis TaxID=1682741 RepID=A0A5A7NLR0_9MICC|nr:amidohydrolase [Zafaria cholistanensis]GER21873.1 amidohydrolase [Zafaria cholistanensis]
MSSTPAPDLIVLDAKVFTANPDRPWAEAFAVAGGRISAVGASADIQALAGPATHVESLGGQVVLPGLSDGHAHLGLGGSMLAWELPLQPTDTKEIIFGKVRDWAQKLGPEEWIVGGIVGSTVMDVVGNVEDLAALDEASGGRPVLLRDDSMHNRWVNSTTLQLMGITADSPDPEGGHYVRDAAAGGALTGVLHEIASAEAEAVLSASLTDPAARHRTSLATALSTLNSYGITSVQDAATMEYSWKALADLESAGEITAWVVGSMPVRPFLETGTVGDELLGIGEAHRSEHVRPDFIKVVLDGVPMTRTTAMLRPYVCHGRHEDPEFRGEPYWNHDDLVETLRMCYDRGLNAKLHATGDASARLVLDAVEQVRKERGPGPIFQIAHVEFLDDADVPRFAELNVVPDASPYIWYPGVIQESIAQQIPAETVDSSWRTRDLVEAGALLAAGSDWPCALPTPDPWIGLETLVTRENPDPEVTTALNPSQRLELEQALLAFTRNPAQAMGLGGVTGSLVPGLSADFIVLDRDIFSIPANEIHRTRVQRTFFAGTEVYNAAPVEATAQ